MSKNRDYKMMSLRKISQMIFLLLILTTACKEKSQKSDQVVIGFSQGLGNHPWREAMNHSMEIQASLHSNVKLEISKADGSVKKQIADIQNVRLQTKLDILE